MTKAELIGLTWNDVDMDSRVISVSHQLIYKDLGTGSHEFYATPPKTKAGMHTIPLTQAAYNAFVKQRKFNAILGKHSTMEIGGYSDFIFLTHTGCPFAPASVNGILYRSVSGSRQLLVHQKYSQNRKRCKSGVPSSNSTNLATASPVKSRVCSKLIH